LLEGAPLNAGKEVGKFDSGIQGLLLQAFSSIYYKRQTKKS
jgi:hypothetical protein